MSHILLKENNKRELILLNENNGGELEKSAKKFRLIRSWAALRWHRQRETAFKLDSVYDLKNDFVEKDDNIVFKRNNHKDCISGIQWSNKIHNTQLYYS